MAIMLTAKHGNENQSKEFLYHFLWSKLSDQFYIWHDLILPRIEQSVDFAILHPNYGMWILAVKDWSIEEIKGGNQKDCLLSSEGRETTVRNPVREAYEKAVTVKILMEKLPILINKESASGEKLYFAIHHLAIFSNITAEALKLRQLWETFPENHVMTADIIRNPLADDTAVENIFIRKREPVFINAFGLNRSQLAAIRKLFSYSGKHAAPDAPASQPDAPQPEAAPERADAPQPEAAPARAEIPAEAAAELPAEAAAEREAPPETAPRSAPTEVEKDAEAEEERSQRVIIRYHDRERDADDEDDRPARPPQAPAAAMPAETPEIPLEMPAPPDAATAPEAGELPEAEDLRVDLNKLIVYIMKHNELILQRMWER